MKSGHAVGHAGHAAREGARHRYRAIPPYDGTRPYRQIPFQYSLHRLDAAGLLEEGAEPAKPLIHRTFSFIY